MKTGFPLQHWYPVIRHGIEKICRIDYVPGRGDRQPLFFEQEIFWLRHCEARISFRHGGETVMEGTKYSDVREFLGCISSAIQKSHILAERFSVTASSSLSIEVAVDIIDEPHIFNDGGTGLIKQYGRDPRFFLHQISRDWFYDDEASRALAIERDAVDVWEKIRYVKPACVTHVDNLWSTAHEPGRNLADVDSFIATQKAEAEALIAECSRQ